MGIRDQKQLQLLRKIGSSQVKPRRLKLLQQRIEDKTYYTQSTFIGYTSVFWAILKVTLSFLANG